MLGRIAAFLRIPQEVRPAYWEETLARNQVSLLIISIMIFGMELFNIVNVLFLSSSGLGTRNNRIYFSLYCALLLAAALALALQRAVRRRSRGVRWAVQYGATLFFLLWHVCVNAYDLYRSPDGEVGIYVTAILAIGVFIQMPSGYSLLSYALAYGLFLTLAGRSLPSGSLLNLTFTTIVGLAVALTRSSNAVVMTAQRQEIQQMNRQLQALLQKDPLTGLLNKTAFDACAACQLDGHESAPSVTLLIFDLDGFKQINDQLGHPCGDHVLREAARALEAVFPDAAGIGRIGGDEFAAVLSGETAPEAEAGGRQLQARLRKIVWLDEPVPVGCSIGICRTSRAGVGYHQLYRAADQALYEAKAAGKGCSHAVRI